MTSKNIYFEVLLLSLLWPLIVCIMMNRRLDTRLTSSLTSMVIAAVFANCWQLSNQALCSDSPQPPECHNDCSGRQFFVGKDGLCKMCEQCLPGYGPDEYCGGGVNGGARCIPCADGYYSTEDMYYGCLPCRICENTAIVQECTSTTDRVCGECLPGFYRDPHNPDFCNQWCDSAINPEGIPDCRSRSSSAPMPALETEHQQSSTGATAELFDPHSRAVAITVLVALFILVITGIVVPLCLYHRHRVRVKARGRRPHIRAEVIPLRERDRDYPDSKLCEGTGESAPTGETGVERLDVPPDTPTDVEPGGSSSTNCDQERGSVGSDHGNEMEIVQQLGRGNQVGGSQQSLSMASNSSTNSMLLSDSRDDNHSELQPGFEVSQRLGGDGEGEEVHNHWSASYDGQAEPLPKVMMGAGKTEHCPRGEGAPSSNGVDTSTKHVPLSHASGNKRRGPYEGQDALNTSLPSTRENVILNITNVDTLIVGNQVHHHHGLVNRPDGELN